MRAAPEPLIVVAVLSLSELGGGERLLICYICPGTWTN
jgi:hypothetical protein